MKNFLQLTILGSALALTACGGSSGSSSFNGTKTLGNGNRYTCPSQQAMDQCTSDATCSKICTITKQVVKPVVPGKGNQCEIKGKTVHGVKGGTCKVSLPKLNGGSPTEISCPASGAIILGNGLQAGSGMINLNGYKLTCN